MTGIASLAMVNVDCANPPTLAEFYHRVLGWDVTHSQDEYAMISDGTTSIGFGRIDDYHAPDWPDPDTPKQFHLDFYVDDLDSAVKRCTEFGATLAEHQPGETWRVLSDPDGHPFCLCVRS